MGLIRNTNLLLEVPTVLFVNEHQIEVISRAKLFIHVPERWRQVKSAEEESDGYCFPCDRKR
jgi:hypothetical protein